MTASEKSNKLPVSSFEKMKSTLILLLSHRTAGIIVLVFVVSIKILQICYLYYLRPDMSFQIIMAHSILHNNSISEPLSFANDISQVHYAYQFKWPPGFALLFTPFYAAFKENHYLAALVFNSLFSIFLILLNRKILRLFEEIVGPDVPKYE